MKNARRLLSLLMALLLVFALAACGGNDDSSATPTPGSNGSATPTPGGNGGEDPSTGDEIDTTLVIGDINPPNTFSLTNRYMSHWERMVFDTLVKSDQDGNIVPSLAESWEYTDDLTLVFHCRDDVYCTDGTQLTANDYLWCLKYWSTETAQAEGMGVYDLENSYCEDDFTLVLKYNEPYGPGINVMISFYMFSQSWAESATGDDWWGAPNGSGPYTVVENVDGAYCSFQRKDDYWGDLPEVTFVTYKYYSEPATMFIDLEKGDIDIAYSLQTSDAERLMANPGDYPNLEYELREYRDVMALILCDYVEYWQDVRVREAFLLSLDAEEIATGMYGALYNKATSPIPSAIKMHIDGNLPEQNIERAKELLAEAGYENGFDLRLVVTTGQDLAATVIQAQANKIGINVNVETYDPGTAVPMMQKGEVDLQLKVGMGGAAYNDPSVGIGANMTKNSTNRAAAFYDEEFNALFQLATYSVDESVRKQAYEDMQNWLIDGFHILPVAERCLVIAYETGRFESIASPDTAYPSVLWIKFAK